MKGISKQLLWHGRAHRFEPHFHTEFFIGIILQGECRFVSGGNTYLGTKGDLVLIPPFEVHEAKCDESTRYHATYISDSVLNQVFGSGVGLSRFELKHQVVRRCPFARRMIDAIESGDLESLWTQVTAVLALHVRPPSNSRLFASDVDLLAEVRIAAMRGEQLGSLAARLRLSPEAFSRLFQQRIGMRAVFCKNQLRLAIAEDELILGKVASIVAHEAGYSDQSHFTRELKKYRGVSPGIYPECYRPIQELRKRLDSAKIFNTFT